MRTWTNLLAAVLIAGGVTAYFLLRGGVEAGSRALESFTNSEEAAAAEDALPSVVVDTPSWEVRSRHIGLSGRTEAAREVTVRSEVSGVVVEASAVEGQMVEAGDPLCRVSVEARAARVAEAEAQLAARRLELDAAEELSDRGHRSANQVAAALAAYDAADAALAQAQIELDNTIIKAPFAGVFDQRDAEIGDYLAVGGACGVVAEVDPILVVSQAAERDVSYIEQGDAAVVRLGTGEVLQGVVRLVQFRADPATRTFRVEVAVANTGGAVRAGLSAGVRLAGAQREVALVPTGVLALSDDGNVGVRVLDAEDMVRFVDVDVFEDTPEGVWVSGLTHDARVIVRGQEFVEEGRRARAVAAPRIVAEG